MSEFREMSPTLSGIASQPFRALIMRVGKLGDTVFMSSVIPPLLEEYGEEIEIDLLVLAGLKELFLSDPRIGKVFEVSNRKIPIPFNLEKLRLVLGSMKRPYDLVVNLETGWILNDLMLMIRAIEKVGTPYETADDDRMGEHAIERLRRIYQHFLPADLLKTAIPSIVPPPSEKFSGLDLPESFVVVNPTNSHISKDDYRSYRSWPAPYWAELIQGLSDSNNVVIVGGKTERPFLNEIGALPKRVKDLVGQTSLEKLMVILDSADAVVTTDTGPGHLAAALDTPVFAIFGPSDDRRTGPYPRRKGLVKILNARLPCSPCSLTGRIRECPKNECMYAVTPDLVLKAVMEIFDQRDSQQTKEIIIAKLD